MRMMFVCTMGSLLGLWRRELFAVEGGHGLDRQAVRCEKNSIERITIAAITALMSCLRLACMTSMAERPQVVQVESYHLVIDIVRRQFDDVVDFIARLAADLTDASIHSDPQRPHISPGFRVIELFSEFLSHLSRRALPAGSSLQLCCPILSRQIPSGISDRRL